MPSFRLRPRAPRAARPPLDALLAIGTQATVGRVALAAQPGALATIGRQATTGRVNLLSVRGRQVTRGLVTPSILCLGRQATLGQCSVTGQSIGTFANGYKGRALVELPPQPDLSGTVANLPFRLTAEVLAALQLKTVANGGLVQSGAGWDIRLEPYAGTPGAAKLDHQFVTAYSPAAGAVDLRFRVPSWDVTTPFRLWLYAGKAGLSASEENPAGVWLAATRTARYDTGADLSGGGKSFTPSGGTITTLAGMPARHMAGTDKLSRLLAAGEVGLQGLAKVTSEIVFQLDAPVAGTADGSLDRAGPPSAGGARFASWIFPTLSYQGGANWYDTATGKQNNCDALTGSVADASLTSLCVVRQSGAAPQLWRNGGQLATTTNVPPTSGIVNVLAGDVHELGASSGARNDTTPGVYALYVLWPDALSPAFIAMRSRSEIEGRSVAGMGSFDAFGDPDSSPVAVPLRVSNSGAQADYDVVPGCFDPDGDPITLASVGASSHPGDATSLTGGKVRYTPQPGWTGGTAEVPFTIADGRGKGSSSRLWATVGASVGSAEPWRDDTTQWATIISLAQATAEGRVVHINSNADLAQLASAVPGKHYVLGANLTGSVTVTAQGSQPSPIIIRGDYDGTDRTQFRKWTSSGPANLIINGAAHVYVTKLCFVGSNNQAKTGQVYITGAATRTSIERCWSYGQSSSTLYETPAYRCDATTNIRYFRIRYCEHGHPTIASPAGMWTMADPSVLGSPNFPQFIYVYRNLGFNMNDTGITTDFGGVLLSIGRGDKASDVDNKAAFYENRIRDMVANGETIEIKGTGTVIAYNTCESSTKQIALRLRQGHDCLIIGNVLVDSPTNSAAATIQARGYDHIIINNWSVTLAAAAQVAANSPDGTSPLQVWGGNVDALSFPASKADQPNTPRPGAIRCQVGGNRMAVVVGANNGEGGLALGACINVIGPAAAGSSVPYRNRSWSIDPADGDKVYAGLGQTKASYTGSPAYGTPVGGSSTVTTKAIANANYDKVPTRLFDADVGIACAVYP